MAATRPQENSVTSALPATVARRRRIARIIVSVCASITLLGAFAADFNKTHILNPKWPPHAKFHDGQTMLLGAFLSACALFYAWRREATGSALRTGILFASLYWFSNGGAILFPGAAWADPDRAGQGLILGLPGAAVIGVVELALLGIALALTSSDHRLTALQQER
jgi:hypothetical protein